MFLFFNWDLYKITAIINIILQDTFANYSCLEYTLVKVKEDFVDLEEIALSSDNAGIVKCLNALPWSKEKHLYPGNYHNNYAVLSYIPRIAEKLKLKKVTYDFKEPQKGKVTQKW